MEKNRKVPKRKSGIEKERLTGERETIKLFSSFYPRLVPAISHLEARVPFYIFADGLSAPIDCVTQKKLVLSTIKGVFLRVIENVLYSVLYLVIVRSL